MSLQLLDTDVVKCVWKRVRASAWHQLEDLSLNQLRGFTVTPLALWLWLVEHENSLYGTKGFDTTVLVWRTIEELESQAPHLSRALKDQWLTFHQDLRQSLGPSLCHLYQDLPQSLSWAERTENTLARRLRSEGHKTDASALLLRYPLLSLDFDGRTADTIRALCLARYPVDRFVGSGLDTWLRQVDLAHQTHVKQAESLSRAQEELVAAKKRMDAAHRCFVSARMVRERLEARRAAEVSAREQELRLTLDHMIDTLREMQTDEDLQQACEEGNWPYLREFVDQVWGSEQTALDLRESFYRIKVGQGDLVPRRCHELVAEIHKDITELGQSTGTDSLLSFSSLELKETMLYTELELEQLSRRLALLTPVECLRRALPAPEEPEGLGEQHASFWPELQRVVDQELQRLRAEPLPPVNQLTPFFDWLQSAQQLLKDVTFHQSQQLQEFKRAFNERQTEHNRLQKELIKKAKARAETFARTFPLPDLTSAQDYEGLVSLLAPGSPQREAMAVELRGMKDHLRWMKSSPEERVASYGKEARKRGPKAQPRGRRGIYELLWACFQLRLAKPVARSLPTASDTQATKHA